MNQANRSIWSQMVAFAINRLNQSGMQISLTFLTILLTI
nr:MAG TPA: hypothetical protein [Caudoviricetes sp.]